MVLTEGGGVVGGVAGVMVLLTSNCNWQILQSMYVFPTTMSRTTAAAVAATAADDDALEAAAAGAAASKHCFLHLYNYRCGTTSTANIYKKIGNIFIPCVTHVGGQFFIKSLGVTCHHISAL